MSSLIIFTVYLLMRIKTKNKKFLQMISAPQQKQALLQLYLFSDIQNQLSTNWDSQFDWEVDKQQKPQCFSTKIKRNKLQKTTIANQLMTHKRSSSLPFLSKIVKNSSQKYLNDIKSSLKQPDNKILNQNLKREKTLNKNFERQIQKLKNISIDIKKGFFNNSQLILPQLVDKCKKNYTYSKSKTQYNSILQRNIDITNVQNSLLQIKDNPSIFKQQKKLPIIQSYSSLNPENSKRQLRYRINLNEAQLKVNLKQQILANLLQRYQNKQLNKQKSALGNQVNLVRQKNQKLINDTSEQLKSIKQMIRKLSKKH